MAVNIQVVRQAAITSGTTQDFTFAGFGTCKAAIFSISGVTADGTATDGARLSLGFTDGVIHVTNTIRGEHNSASSNERDWATNDQVIQIMDASANSIDGEANFDSLITDGIRVNWGNLPSVAYLVTATLFGGSDLTASVVIVTNTSTIDGDTAVTGIGFEADVVFGLTRVGTDFTDNGVTGADMGIGFCHNDKAGTITQYSHTYRGHNAAAVGDPRTIYQTNRFYRQSLSGSNDRAVEITAFDSDGWTSTTRDQGAASYYGALALDFNGAVESWVGQYSAPVSTGNDAITSPGFKPQFVMHALGTLTSASRNTGAPAGTMGASFVTATNQYCNTIANEEGSLDMDTQSISDDQAINLPLDDGSAGAAATFVSFDTTGWTYNYSTVISGPVLWPTLAIEENAAGGGGSQSIVPLVQQYHHAVGGLT